MSKASDRRADHARDEVEMSRRERQHLAAENDSKKAMDRKAIIRIRAERADRIAKGKEKH